MSKQIKAGADIHAGDGGYSEGTQEQYDAFVKVRNKSLAQGRIRDLAEQAGFYANPDVEKFEKFAELIVGECADIALKSSSVPNKSEQAKAEADRIYHKIQEHFGVEE